MNLTFPENKIIIAAHHKSGATFSIKFSSMLEEQFSIKVWRRFNEVEPATWDVLLHQHSRVMDIKENFKGVHFVRHPFALIYSACLYHEKAKEDWLNLPLNNFDESCFDSLCLRRNYNTVRNKDANLSQKLSAIAAENSSRVFSNMQSCNGKSYQEHLINLKSIEEKLIFEMSAFSQGVIQDLMAFPNDQRYYNAKLELFSHQQSMEELFTMLVHLGFSGKSLLKIMNSIAQETLWYQSQKPNHATTGMSHEWEAYFKGDVLACYRELFGYPEKALGYD